MRNVVGFDALGTAGSWKMVDDFIVQNVSATTLSQPFYDTEEGFWRVLLTTKTSTKLATAARIGGPYSNRQPGSKDSYDPGSVSLPSVDGALAAAPWSGDATHFAVFAARNGSHLGFCYSWNGYSWPGDAAQMVAVGPGAWAKQLISVAGMIEEPAAHGTFVLFFNGRDADGEAAVGVMQVEVSYSG